VKIRAGERIDRTGDQDLFMRLVPFVSATNKAKRFLAWAVWALSLVGTMLLGGCQDGEGTEALDRQLRAVIGESGITPLEPGPSPDPAMVALGQALFFDRELSGNRDVSCATCHHPRFTTGDAIPLSVGSGGTDLGPERRLGQGHEFIARNATELFNRGSPEWTTMFWDNRVNGTPEIGFHSPAVGQLPPDLDNILAAQAMFPVASDEEMRGLPGDVDLFGHPNELGELIEEDYTAIWDGLMKRILAIPGYRDLFADAYPDLSIDQLGFQHAANAIAAFEIDAWTYLDSPWDRYLAGEDSALSDDARRGALLFYGEAGCARCHSGNLFTDQETHNVAVPQLGPGKDEEAPLDIGRARVTNYPGDMFAFRTPPLRNVGLTGPWMHNGAFGTLEGALRHMLNPHESLRNYEPGQLAPELQTAVHDDPATLDLLLATVDPLVATPIELSDAEFTSLMAFLHALTDPAAMELREDIPPSVPSGLAVEDVG
jgi:cytochrome c peroxidase